MEHTSKQFELELEDLRSGLLAMGGMVEAQLERALEAIASGETELVDVVVREEKRVNDKQLELDRKSMEIIAKRQPTAVDLRQIVCTMQAVNDLERIGDEIKKIALRAKQFQASERFQILRLNEAKQIGLLAQDMLKEALNAFARLDIISAGEVIGKDMAVDEEFERIMRLLVTYMMEDPRTIGAGLDVAFLAKAIERVADHAKNISEYVIHIVQGKDPRHGG
ncbi:MAG TPA: phosphate signaling complex protein PhoU [Casimicrobium sp.]|jgi:phosphate transport system protein|nr:phosphate signaling complex protein PhoU [Casimicrobium sp.]HPG60656.1 phosphate signaling complex protein PhoU [Casimicrobium sp.]HPT55187.1 phosphate signaling complex protein PhoU [Casimicrobium sp.]HPV23293.1 phosphate signaling complex protein PhoU [Casimicrobium sp.]